jgi:hypothetical protein
MLVDAGLKRRTILIERSDVISVVLGCIFLLGISDFLAICLVRTMCIYKLSIGKHLN